MRDLNFPLACLLFKVQRAVDGFELSCELAKQEHCMELMERQKMSNVRSTVRAPAQ
jgi:hypothetical protein